MFYQCSTETFQVFPETSKLKDLEGLGMEHHTLLFCIFISACNLERAVGIRLAKKLTMLISDEWKLNQDRTVHHDHT